MKKNWTRGLVHLYTGDGKGKTTASIGLAIRALGAGLRVTFAQFMKGGESSELEVLTREGARLVRIDCSKKFVFAMNEPKRKSYSEVQSRIFTNAMILANDTDVLVLDEIISAIDTDMVDLDSVVDFLKSKPEGLEVIMTGRNAPREIIENTDYLSCVQCIRHPYEAGVVARTGIEY